MKKKNSQQAPQLTPDVLAKIRERATAIAEPHGLAVHDVVFGPTDLGLTLSVLICSPDGKAISVIDCELISRPLSKELDELLEDTTAHYMFEVSSVGVDPKDIDWAEESAQGGTLDDES